MKVIEPGFEIITPKPLNGDEILRFLEMIGRTCYKSEDRITDRSAEKFVRNIVRNGHYSVLEHVNITVKFICDRGVSHELVRHRLASYSQESTRYCNYEKDDFGNEITVIRPFFWREDSYKYGIWKKAMEHAETHYMSLITRGATPQEARSVLPNSLKTEIVMTCNLREWRHVLELRTSKASHPQIRQVMTPLLARLRAELPDIFGDLL